MLNVGLHKAGSLTGFLSSLAPAPWAERGRDLSTAAMGTGELKFVVKTTATALSPTARHYSCRRVRTTLSPRVISEVCT